MVRDFQKALPLVRAALASHGSAVFVAPPGAGKTTRTPLALLEESWLGGGKILLLEPRRLAARAAALRMADLLGEEDVGGTVGYRMRLDTRVGPDTRIEVVTEGILTRMLQSDPALDGVALVIFDEFHERSLHADLGLALTLHARKVLRDDLRVMVMSATLDAEPVSALLGNAPVVLSEGRMYPVDTRWLDRPVDGWIEPAVAETVRRALAEAEGDVLVFLPGAAEIRRTAEALSHGVSPETDVYQLFGMLPRSEQDRALRPAPTGRRKVVLASAIAETSLTIEGVRVVVDSGLMRVPRFDPGTGMSRLETLRVTRDSADQRRGRAGRTAPGVCHRMWTRGEDRGLVPARAPEIREADLTSLVLELAAWGAVPGELSWLDAPPEAAVSQARELLLELEALDEGGVLTDHGGRIAALGLHPRLAHMVLRGVERGLGALACDMAALMEERDILRRGEGTPEADLRSRVEALAPGRTALARGVTVDRAAASRVRRQAGQIRRRVGVEVPDSGTRRAGAEGSQVAYVGTLAALAYPDRVGQLRQGARGRFLLRNGRGVTLDTGDVLAAEPWIVAVELDGRGREGRIFQCVPVTLDEIEELFGGQILAEEEVRWDDEAGRVRARAVRRLGALVLKEGALRRPDADRVAAALCEGVAQRGLHVLPWGKETEQLRDRLAYLHQLEPERWPDGGEAALVAALQEWLAPFARGLRSLDDLPRLDLAQALSSLVPWDQRAVMDRLAPTHLEVPSGSRIALDYSDPAAPALAVRLQEVFGMVDTPRVGGGRTPLTLRLLSPAMRPVQVTRDLASFWENTYFEVRKDLRARYPKHAWPEAPLTAEATRRTRRRGP